MEQSAKFFRPYGMPAISPARAANVATHAWIKLYTEILSCG